MKQTVRWVMMMGLLVAVAGCFEHTYTMGVGAPTGPVVYDEWHNQWLGGLIGERNLRVQEICPSGNATIHDEQSFLNGLVSALTAGIYTPTVVTIRCDTGRSVDINLDEGEVMTILEAPVFLEIIEDRLPERLADAQEGLRALEDDR